jgi:hypothetical protein
VAPPISAPGEWPDPHGGQFALGPAICGIPNEQVYDYVATWVYGYGTSPVGKSSISNSTATPGVIEQYPAYTASGEQVILSLRREVDRSIITEGEECLFGGVAKVYYESEAMPVAE